MSRSDIELLRAYEPVLRFTAGELFFPTAVEGYIESCSLWELTAGGAAECLVPVGELSVERLVATAVAPARDAELSLRFVAQPLGRGPYRAWRRRPDRPAFRTSGRFTEVGVLARLIDALFRFSLVLRGRVPGGLSAAAEIAYRTRLEPLVHPYYARVTRDAGYVALQYWFFYAMNDWRSSFGGANDHEADWEQVTVYLVEGRGGDATPAWVACSAHDEVGDDLRRRWDDPELVREGDHVVVHPGAGSHSGAFVAGAYVTAVQPPGRLRPVVNGCRRILSVLAPWARGEIARGVGIPFVDYCRGDGETIGPGHARSWSPVLVDDDVAWVRDFRGLWGLDTRDRFGGERAPAGPRYERDGSIRRSWSDPLGWAGLQKVPATPEEAAGLIDARIGSVTEELAELSTVIDDRRATLRTATVQARLGVAAERVAPLELDVAQLVARRAALDDERRSLCAARAESVPDAGPRAHLRSTATPIGHQGDRRPRFLRVWSTISTPLLFVAAAFVVAASNVAAFTAVGAFVVVFLGIEAWARRSFLAFAAALGIVVVGWVVALAALSGLLDQWRSVLAALLGIAAVATLLVNVRDLRR